MQIRYDTSRQKLFFVFVYKSTKNCEVAAMEKPLVCELKDPRPTPSFLLASITKHQAIKASYM
jgi:hypothetical protein